MSASTEENEEKNPILARIERLETENRRLKQGGLICVLAIASTALMGQTTQHKAPVKKPAAPVAPAAPVIPDKIEAQSFVLVDAAGKPRADLAMGGIGPSFRLLDQTGSAMVTISLNDATPGGPVLLLSDPSHKGGIAMSVQGGAGPQLSLTGEDQTAMAHMSVTKDGTSLELFDQNENSTSIGNGLRVSKSGKTQESSAASIALYNKDRKVLWSAP
jgi:hypothetical protein